MNLPNLPTDNLYKFHCLVGFILVVVSLLFGLFNVLSLNKDTNKIYKDMQIVELKLAALKSNESIPSDIKNQVIEIRRQTQDVYDQLGIVKMVMNIGVIAGTFMYVYSSILWYLRLQRYEDIIIRGKAEEYGRGIKKLK